jgi:hypothetical protein
METTYTVYKPWNGEVLGRGLTAIQAAKEIIGYGGYVCAIKREGELWYLYTSDISPIAGCARLLRTMFSSAAESTVEAWEEIAEKVIKHHFDDRLRPIAVPEPHNSTASKEITTTILTEEQIRSAVSFVVKALDNGGTYVSKERAERMVREGRIFTGEKAGPLIEFLSVHPHGKRIAYDMLAMSIIAEILTGRE